MRCAGRRPAPHQQRTNLSLLRERAAACISSDTPTQAVRRQTADSRRAVPSAKKPRVAQKAGLKSRRKGGKKYLVSRSQTAWRNARSAGGLSIRHLSFVLRHLPLRGFAPQSQNPSPAFIRRPMYFRPAFWLRFPQKNLTPPICLSYKNLKLDQESFSPLFPSTKARNKGNNSLQLPDFP